MNKSLWTLLGVNNVLLLLMLVGISVAVLFLDQPLACYAHQFGLDKLLWLDHFTENSPQIIVVFGLYLITTQLNDYKWSDKLFLVIVMAIILIITLECKDLLKCLLGRNWPAFWLGIDNPSASPYANSYGFHVGFGSNWQGSMPSGHTSFIGGLSMMLWLLFPRVRKIIMVFCVALVIALIMLNHHYLGDCLAGFTLAAFMNQLFIVYYYFFAKQKINRRISHYNVNETLENNI